MIWPSGVVENVSDHVVLRDLDQDPAALWSLLLMSGYLTARKVTLSEGTVEAELVLPNVELRHVFRQSITSWLNHGLRGSRNVKVLLQAMLSGDESVDKAMEAALKQIKDRNYG